MSERGDIVDRANSRVEEILNDALAEHFRSRESLPPSEDCIDCGEAIPVARIKANPNACRCIDCQTDHDRWERFQE